MIGTVYTWDKARAFGFIKCDDPDFSDVFIGEAQLPEGDPVGLRVEFEIAPPSDDNRLGAKEGRARNVTVVGRSDVVVPDEVRLDGVVVFLNEERGYGFLSDGHTSGRRVWFGTNSMQGETFETGDHVEFELTKTLRDTGRAASRVWKK